MYEKLKDFDLDIVANEGDDGEASTFSVSAAVSAFLSASSWVCLEASISLFTATPALTTGSNYTETGDC